MPLSKKVGTYIIGIAVILLCAVVYTHNTSTREYLPGVFSNSQLKEFLDNPDKYAIIDVRNKVEYDRGHIPGAIHAEYHDTESLKRAAHGKIPITYCTFSAWRGPYAAYSLYREGYTTVGVLTGGIKSWNEAKEPIVTEIENETPHVYPHPEKDLLFPPRTLISTERANNASIAQFRITAKQFAYEPSHIIVKKGQHVILHITSTDVPHGFALPEYHIVEEILPSQTKKIEFIADREGVFPFLCSVYCGSDAHSGHSHMSMVGELRVQ